MAKYANQHCCDYKFKKGNKVMLSTKALDLKIFTSRPNCALSTRFIGLYTVEKHVGGNSYKLCFPPNICIHSTIHISQLKLYIEFSLFPEQSVPSSEPLPAQVDWIIKNI